MTAIEIDSRIAEPHASLGLIHGHYEWRWREAEEEFGKAAQLKPSYATAHHWYGMFLFFVGKHSEAYGQIVQAIELDPLSRVIGLSLAHLLIIVGRRGEAIEQCKRVIEENPDYADAHRSLGFMYYMDSKTDEAIEEVRRAVAISGEDVFMKGELASLLGLVGRREEASRILEELQKLSRVAYVPSVELAQGLLGLGRTNAQL